MRIAESWADSRVYAERAQVGAIAVKGGQIISDGYNGLPTGVPNDQVELTTDGLMPQLVTNERVIHAEENVILKCAANGGSGLRGATVYCSFSACARCADRLVQVGITRFVFRKPYRDRTGLSILRAAGITVEQLPGETP